MEPNAHMTNPDQTLQDPVVAVPPCRWPDRTDQYTYTDWTAIEAMSAEGLALAWAVNESITADRKQHRREVAWSIVAMVVGVALGVWLTVAVLL